MTLYFDLDSFSGATNGESADNELLKRVDRRVASYYLAVPLAGEDDRVTVATVYPDNAAALWVLKRLLRADVVAVSATEDELHKTIARVYPAETPAEGAILAWSDDPAWVGAVAAAADVFGAATARPVISLDSSATLDEALEQAERDFSLFVARVSDEASLARLVLRSPVSLLLVRGEFAPIDHILVVLRGFGSDHETLDQVLPILTQGGTEATVLPLSRSEASRLNDLLADSSPARLHLKSFLRDLDRKNVQVDIKLCQGDPVSQIATEIARGPYAMLVIAAEGEGQFVWRALSRIEGEGAWPDRPVLIVKPPVRPEELGNYEG